MPTITEIKEQTVTETPLVLFECELASGAVERWSTHAISFEGNLYEARILRHNLFEMRSGSEDGVDAVARTSITLANADSHFSQIERNTGWKGSRVTVRFVFFDLRQGVAASEPAVLFRGIADAPEEITESTLRLSVTNSLNLQRALLPDVRVQKRCPWNFPVTLNQRAEAVMGGAHGKYSPFFRCGYSADCEGGAGNLDSGAPFTSCDRTRASCELRGMFSMDAGANHTRRFGGIEFVPPTTAVRSFGEKGYHYAKAVENEARYNDFVPLIYGTCWFAPLIVFSKNDGNLTRMEALLGMGEIQGVTKVLVNGIEIPLGQAGKNMTGTGWFSLTTAGNRFGNFNPDFRDGAGNPLGDPYGSMAALSIVVPNRINDGRSLPDVQVLVQGMKLDIYGEDGSYLGESFTSNPAWVLLDVLRRCGWRIEDIGVGSFARAATYCDELIPARDLYGNPIEIPRFQCNLSIKKRRSAGDVIRGIRNGARLLLTYGSSGALELTVENTLALQNPSKPATSNSSTPLNGGWPSYEFGDGSNGFSSILRRGNGEPTVRLWSRSAAETPNRFSLEFQDSLNEYQQDSVSLVDVDDVLKTGQEISLGVPAMGVANFHQATRAVKLHLDKSVTGNTYVQFETSVRGLGLRPGDIITVTYLKEGFERQPFRILRIAPGMNYSTSLIVAQIHHEWWYSDSADLAGNTEAGRQAASGIGVPRPLLGPVIENGEPQFGVAEKSAESTDGGSTVTLSVNFIVPPQPAMSAAAIPIVSLAPAIATTAGSLAGGQTLYYAVTALDGSGGESAISFVVRATIPPGSNTNTVTLTGMGFSSAVTAFNVYRGSVPTQLLRIASGMAPAAEFPDPGLPVELAGPPDENYDHANFYWRLEQQPAYPATIRSADAIGNESLAMEIDVHRGMVARIVRGLGAGQERVIISNTATTLTIAAPWDVEPDDASEFVVAESGWHFGAAAQSSPVEFEVPNRVGATVHISGRAANVHDRETAPEVSPVTRWRISGAGAPLDAAAPGRPFFGLALRGRGAVELSAISFETLENTRTISTATLTLYYWNELSSPSPAVLAAPIAPEDASIDLSAAGSAEPGTLIQIESEIARVDQVLNGGVRYEVTRGFQGSTAASHGAQAPVYHLDRKVFLAPIARDFFGSPASGDFSYPILLPDARVAAADLFVTNIHGDSETATACFTNTADGGLRTLSGGQLTIQVDGFLAIQSNAAPPLIVDQPHSVRDVLAVVREAPTIIPVELEVRVDDQIYCTLTIPPNSTYSNTVNGFGRAPLAAGSQLNVDIVSLGQIADAKPGRDLTVSIRL